MRIAIACLLLLVAGCGRSPETQFFTLRPVETQHTAYFRKVSPPLQVGRVTLPSSLDRRSLVTGGEGVSVNVSDRERWIAPLPELVRRALTEDLRNRLGTAAVLTPGDPLPPKGARTLALNVQDFMVNADGEVVLTSDWTVESRVAGEPAFTEHSTVTARAASMAGGDVAEGMSRALALLADRMAARLSS
ncbi:MAG: membrane integrity-associated transporter subunit PqiC [Acetobacteraceae bacterium]